METRDKVVEKIKKLLTLAQNNSNLEEATAAAEKAQALMEKHRIEQAVLDMRDALGVEPLQDGGLPNAWKVFLAYVLAKHNGCYLIKSDAYDRDNKLLLVGESQDTRSVQSLYKYLAVEFNRLCFDAIMCYQKMTGQLPSKAYVESFFTGATQAVDARLKDITTVVRNEQIVAAGTENVVKVCSAIERLDNRIQAAKDWVVSKNIDGIENLQFKSESVKTDSREGFTAGARAAADLELERKDALKGD